MSIVIQGHFGFVIMVELEFISTIICNGKINISAKVDKVAYEGLIDKTNTSGIFIS